MSARSPLPADDLTPGTPRPARAGDTVRTAAELDALPVGSVVMFPLPNLTSPVPFERRERGWQQPGSESTYETGLMADRYLPAEFLYRPDAPQPATTDDAVDDVLAYLMNHVTPREAEIVAHTWAEDIVAIARAGEVARARGQALRDAITAVDAVEFDDNDAGAHDALWLAHLAIKALAARGDATPTVTTTDVRDIIERVLDMNRAHLRDGEYPDWLASAIAGRVNYALGVPVPPEVEGGEQP